MPALLLKYNNNKTKKPLSSSTALNSFMWDDPIDP